MITPNLPKETVAEIDFGLKILSEELRTTTDRIARAEVINKINACLDDRLKHTKVLDLEKFGAPQGTVGVSINV